LASSRGAATREVKVYGDPYGEKRFSEVARVFAGVITQGGKIVRLAGQTATRMKKAVIFPATSRRRCAIFSLIDKTLNQAGGRLANLVTMTTINDPRHGDRFVKMREFFPDGNFSASALITVSHFARPGMLIRFRAWR
jgi:hypothetical protein